MKNNKLKKGMYKPIDFDPKAYAENERANNPEFAAAYDNLSDTPITQADIDSGKLKLVKRKTNGQIETDYLLSSPTNAVHLMESIAQLKAGETQTHELVKMTANMQAGDLPIDSNFENMPPAGRELI